MNKKNIIYFLYLFLILAPKTLSYNVMFINSDENNYKIINENSLTSDTDIEPPFITEEKLKEIIEKAKRAPLPEETIEIKNKEKLYVQNKYNSDVEIVEELKNTFNKYNFSNKKSDIHVGRINSNEFTSDQLIDNSEIGIGISYQDQNKKLKERIINDSEDWNYTPIYATGKYIIEDDENSTKYLKLNFGYSFKEVSKDEGRDSEDKLQGGVYYGIGGGIDFRDMSVGIMYQVNKDGRESQNSYKDDSRVTFSVDYKLGL